MTNEEPEVPIELKRKEKVSRTAYMANCMTAIRQLSYCLSSILSHHPNSFSPTKQFQTGFLSRDHTGKVVKVTFKPERAALRRCECPCFEHAAPWDHSKPSFDLPMHPLKAKSQVK